MMVENKTRASINVERGNSTSTRRRIKQYSCMQYCYVRDGLSFLIMFWAVVNYLTVLHPGDNDYFRSAKSQDATKSIQIHHVVRVAFESALGYAALHMIETICNFQD
jgi:penicillin-binding protein-related factor A (putative recombinase)